MKRDPIRVSACALVTVFATALMWLLMSASLVTRGSGGQGGSGMESNSNGAPKRTTKRPKAKPARRSTGAVNSIQSESKVDGGKSAAQQAADEAIKSVNNYNRPSAPTDPCLSFFSGLEIAGMVPAPLNIHPGPVVRNKFGIEFVLIPAGSFCMGSYNGEVDEKPEHGVNISNDFYMGRTEVTQAQWQAVIEHNSSYVKRDGLPVQLVPWDTLQSFIESRPSYFKGDNLPVEQISWDAIQTFINTLNGLNDGFWYRLPTEAEWEYACRAGTTGDYAGNLDSMAWYFSNSGSQTHPVGTKQPNAFGLYDMHGNVWEWCQDFYDEKQYRSVMSPDPQGPSSGRDRVLRGGSWYLNASALRSGNRGKGDAASRHNDSGFRVVAVARTR